MGAPPDIRFGILKCRDLVQLYYGARMVTFVKEATFSFNSAASPVQLLQQSPARIAYQVDLQVGLGAETLALLGSFDDVAAGIAPTYAVEGSGIVIQRSFLNEMDSICLPLYGNFPPGGGGRFNVREILLSPIPIDEYP